VWQEAIVHKLLSMNFPMFILKIVKSYLSNRESFVYINRSYSNKFQINAGVPQGGILSPTLFNYFINDIPTPPNCKLALYADDTSLISTVNSKNFDELIYNLKMGFETINTYFLSWKIKINAEKTNCGIFTHSTIVNRLKNTKKIKINLKEMEWLTSVKFLGVILDQKLLFKLNCENNIKKANIALSFVYPILRKHNKTTIESKLLLYKSHIRPILIYACPAWANTASCHLKKLQVFQNKCLRMALNMPYCTPINKLHLKSNTLMITEQIEKITVNFYKRCNSSENELIARLGNYTVNSFNFRIKHKMPKKI
jgi:hypothetical protein